MDTVTLASFYTVTPQLYSYLLITIHTKLDIHIFTLITTLDSLTKLDRGDYKQGWQIDKEWDLAQLNKR